MMTPIAKIALVVSFLFAAVVVAFIAMGMDMQNAAAQSRYLAPAFDTSIVKHADADQNARMDIAFGSDDAAYRTHADTTATPSLYQTLTSKPVVVVTIASLPNTAAPHGSTTCTLTDSRGNVFTVQADDCSTL